MVDSWDGECWYCSEALYGNCPECFKPLCEDHARKNDGLCDFCAGERLARIYELEQTYWE